MLLCVCIGCGCDDLHACRTEGFFEEEACSWLVQSADRKLGVCSACLTWLTEFRKGNRELSKRAAARVRRRDAAARVSHARRRKKVA